MILFVQTFGDLVNFNPHVHVLAADGAFLADGRFVALPAVPQAFLAEGFRRAVVAFLVNNQALSDELRGRMLAWRHSGFSAHNAVRVAAEDTEGRKKLAGYMLRAPMSLEKMSYDAATGSVIYRSKMLVGLKRARVAWARLIRKVYEADPRECPKCKGPMRVIALIDDPHVVRRILEHLRRWAAEPAERDPPEQAPEWPANAVIPAYLPRSPRHRVAHSARPAARPPRASRPAVALRRARSWPCDAPALQICPSQAQNPCMRDLRSVQIGAKRPQLPKDRK